MLVGRTIVACSAALVLVGTSDARAEPTKDECVDADTHGQDARAAGKFRDARAQFEICTSSSCPAIVRSDCTERLEDVTKNAPTLIFEVKDANGSDLAATKVTVDGKPLVDRLDGKAVAVDTGEHTFVFTSPGHLPNTQHLLIHEGDRGRRVHVVVGAVAEAQPDTTPATKPEERHEEEQHREEQKPASPGSTQRVLGLTLGGIGLGGLAVAAIFTGVSASVWQQAQNECSTTSCDHRSDAISDHNTAYDYAVAATVAVIAGGVLAATGLIVFLAAPRSHGPSSARLHVTPMLGPTSGFILSGAF